MSVHLDFVEGHCLAGARQVPLLVKEGSDLMGLSWGGLFTLSHIPWKSRVAKKQLKREIKAQIERVQETVICIMDLAKEQGIACKQKSIRIDSHQHAHMIPVVWEALTEVIEEERYEVEYIRNSKEVLGAFLSEASLWKTYRPVNSEDSGESQRGQQGIGDSVSSRPDTPGGSVRGDRRRSSARFLSP